MKVNLNLDYVIREQERNQPGSYFAVNRQVSELLIRFAIDAKYKDGVKDRVIRRVVSPILKALAKAVNEKLDVVELSLEQLTFVLETLEAYACPPSWLGLVDDLVVELEALKKAAEDEKAKKAS